MSKIEFKELCDATVDSFGVDSYIDNGIEDEVWVTCPICGEPILWEDYGEDMDNLLTEYGFICPICEEEVQVY